MSRTLTDFAKSIRQIALDNPDRRYVSPQAPDGTTLKGAQCRYVHSGTESMFVVNLDKSHDYHEPHYLNRDLTTVDPDTLEGGCIVGLACEDLGVDLVGLLPFEGNPGGYVARRHTDTEEPTFARREAIDAWINYVQTYQDQGEVFRKAIAQADDDYRKSAFATETVMDW